MISLGFATIENLMYVYGFQGEEIQVAVMRMFTAIPGHAAFGVIMGYYVGLAKFDSVNQRMLLFKGLLAATFAHAIYDYFLFIDGGFILSMIALVIAIIYSKKAIKIHQDNSPFRPK
jgi:RsiW-degrading membrane proteinase PrsW (M82 family)